MDGVRNPNVLFDGKYTMLSEEAPTPHVTKYPNFVVSESSK